MSKPAFSPALSRVSAGRFIDLRRISIRPALRYYRFGAALACCPTCSQAAGPLHPLSLARTGAVAYTVLKSFLDIDHG
jgi:hypothetical protein